MPEDLKYDSSNGRELFLVALREFSEGCRPPELIEACPFSVQAEPGVRSCGEECMDILGANGGPDAVAMVDLGDGLSAPKRVVSRPRRIPVEQTKPFDAREMYQADAGSGEPSRWRLAALVYGLGEHMKEAPPFEPSAFAIRRERIAELIRLIESRGLRVTEHLEPWLRQRAVEHLISTLRRPVLQQELPDFANGVKWVELLASDAGGPLAGEDDDTVARRKFIYQKTLRTVITWGQSADFEDLVAWTPPERVADAFPPRVSKGAGVDDGLWMIDRFCKTYLSEWQTGSLRQEWLYLHGNLMPPCVSTEMSVRQIPEDELAKVMADRMANLADPDRGHPKVPNLVEPAVAFLQEGRRTEAAALFEALLLIDRENADNCNNLGFCVLPDDPVGAIELLDQARDLNPELLVPRLNRILALALVGRLSEAISAGRMLHEEAEARLEVEGGWLWNAKALLMGSGPSIEEVASFGAYLTDLRLVLEEKSVCQ